MKLFKNPVYKKKQKHLWKTKNGFSKQQTNDGKFVWEQQDHGEKLGRNPYFVSLKQMGDEAIQRVRKEEKEMNKKRKFDSMVCPDNWRNEFMVNNSLRSGFNLEA